MIKIAVEKRDLNTSPDCLRSSGKVPAVFYGQKESSTPIAVSLSEFKKVWRAAGETSVINLSGDGIDLESLIYEVKCDPVTDIPTHVDFYVIEKGKKLEINIPLEFVGIAPAVRDLGGVLIKVLHEMKIEALPKDLPHKLEVDISTLATLDSVVTAKEVKLPEGVTLIVNPDAVVASIAEIKEEEVVVAPVDLSAIEVAKKGKIAKEGEEPAESDAKPAK
ncbi:MAG: 50S ribosomal protein L25 [bacterium]